jgi:hypothetical protein
MYWDVTSKFSQSCMHYCSFGSIVKSVSLTKVRHFC